MKNVRVLVGVVLIVLAVISVLVWEHTRPANDIEIRSKVSGSWFSDIPKTMWNFAPDGSWTYSQPGHGQKDSSAAGTWQIKDGVLIVTTTNDSITTGQSLVGRVLQSKIVRVDSHQLVEDIEGGETITLNRP
jgi:hypothetical protein